MRAAISDANLRLASCTLHPVCSIHCPCMITHNVAFITALLRTQSHSSAASLKLPELIFIHFLPSRVALSLEPSSNSKNWNLTLWLCFLRSVNNCWLKKATFSNHPPLMQRGFLCEEESHYVQWSVPGGHIKHSLKTFPEEIEAGTFHKWLFIGWLHRGQVVI